VLGILALTKVWTVSMIVSAVFGLNLGGLVFAVALAIVVAVGVRAGRSGGVRAGAFCGLWVGLGGAVSLFVAGMISTLVTDYPSRALAELMVSDNLGGLIVMLLFVPVLAAFVSAAAATAVRGPGPAGKGSRLSRGGRL
jgi:hypothetical protein